MGRRESGLLYPFSPPLVLVVTRPLHIRVPTRPETRQTRRQPFFLSFSLSLHYIILHWPRVAFELKRTGSSLWCSFRSIPLKTSRNAFSPYTYTISVASKTTRQVLISGFQRESPPSRCSSFFPFFLFFPFESFPHPVGFASFAFFSLLAIRRKKKTTLPQPASMKIILAFLALALALAAFVQAADPDFNTVPACAVCVSPSSLPVPYMLRPSQRQLV